MTGDRRPETSSSDLRSPVSDLVPLQAALLGRFLVERQLGRGGMGTVWLARDLRLDRPVAIKVLHPELAARPDERERFLHEARTAARLSHPHIVPVLGVIAEPAVTAIVMAMIDGESLASRVASRGPLTATEAERLIRELAWALGYAHQSGVLHRDVSAANVLIERHTGRTLLVDFGLAATTSSEDSQSLIGTPGYLAPELIRGETGSIASDMYALGAVAFLASAGRPPFQAEAVGELLAKHLVQPAPDLATHARGVSRRFAAAVGACLSKDPADRPASAEAFIGLLERAIEPIVVAPPLEAWFTRWERYRTITAVALPVVALQTWVLVDQYFTTGIRSLMLIAVGFSVLTVFVGPLLAYGFAEIAGLRHLQRKGFGLADIQAAWSHWTDRLEREHLQRGLAPLPGRVLFDLSVCGAVGLAVLFLVIWPILPILAPTDAWATKTALLSMASTVYLAVMTGFAINLVAPAIRLAPRGWIRRLAERFWHSPLAVRLARRASRGVTVIERALSTAHRRTELVLGLAIEDLWGATPEPVRRELGQIPDIARALQRGAEELRHLERRLREAIDALPNGEQRERERLTAVTEGVATRQREAVAALERLRLDLLRNLAIQHPTDDLGSALAHARELEHALLAELAGHEEVRRLLGRPRRRSSGRATPTPSPAAA